LARKGVLLGLARIVTRFLSRACTHRDTFSFQGDYASVNTYANLVDNKENMDWCSENFDFVHDRIKCMKKLNVCCGHRGERVHVQLHDDLPCALRARLTRVFCAACWTCARIARR
jgi:hypothetical protein